MLKTKENSTKIQRLKKRNKKKLCQTEKHSDATPLSELSCHNLTVCKGDIANNIEQEKPELKS